MAGAKFRSVTLTADYIVKSAGGDKRSLFIMSNFLIVRRFKLTTCYQELYMKSCTQH